MHKTETEDMDTISGVLAPANPGPGALLSQSARRASFDRTVHDA